MLKYQKTNKLTLIIGMFSTVVILSLTPFFVWAKTCYVDDGSSGGDGSKDDPYETIGEAIDEDCDTIKLKKGKYKESFTLSSGTELKGSGSDSVVEGEIKMKNDCSLESLKVEDGGVEVLKNARVTIDDVKIEDSHIGIVTSGSGKLTLKNSTISHNGKGLYLQYGKNVDIRNNKVVHNREEGIDIRANVDGIISGNQIESNKEGGIEVIAGKSQLTISNNSIRYNKASGIAIQFYKENSGLGNLKISGNTLIGNGNYGIDCKIPSGGRPEANYWSKSVSFSYNKVGGNGKGGFSDFCGFSGDEVLQATKTEEEIKEIKSKEELERQQKEEEARKKKEEEERLKKEEEERVKREQQKRLDLDKLDKLKQKMPEYEKECEFSHNDQDIFVKRSKWLVFLIGYDDESLKRMEFRKQHCEQALEELKNRIEEIKTEEVKEEARQKYLNSLLQKKESLDNEMNKMRKKGLFRWFSRR